MGSKPLVGFVFTYLNRRPTDVKDLKENAWVRLQMSMIGSFAKRHANEQPKFHAGFLIGRRKAFVDAEMFLIAVDTALANEADLVVGDLQELLMRTPAKLIDHSIEKLDQLDVGLWDARSGDRWASITPERRAMVGDLARFASTTRSRSIARSQKMAKVKRPASAANAERASRTNKQLADKRAENLREFVSTLVENVPMGATLTPTLLAQRLNEAGIPAARGGEWSLNAAKNLLKRLEQPAAGITDKKVG